jgi:adenosine deaminase
MVVPEAYLCGSGNYSKVYVVTSESEASPYLPIKEYFSSLDSCELLFHRVQGFNQLRDESEHALFLEALQRIYLLAREDAKQGRLDICLTGGFKTMSAALQRTARLLGASSLFHVLCEDSPDKAEHVDKCYSEGKIRCIQLGQEPGQRLLDDICSEAFPIHFESLSTGERLVLKQKTLLLIDEIARRETILRRRGDPSTPPNLYPFHCIGFLSDEWLDWLSQPLNPSSDESWIRSLPKVELHSHLGGFATHGDLLQQVRSAATQLDNLPKIEEPSLPPNWPLPSGTTSLTDYMALGDATGSSLLRDPGCLAKHVELLLQSLSDDGVHYAEIRCSPVNYACEKSGRSPIQVVEDIRRIVREASSSLQAQGRLVPQISLIIIVNRSRSGDLSRISEHVALATSLAGYGNQDCPVVGIDLAGFENPDTRPEYFRQDFEPAHRKGLAVTVHAGENDDPESIWQAVYQLSARRIGHGLNLLDAPHLLRAVADRGIGIELCPYANYQIVGFSPMPEKKEYPLLAYLDHGVKATVNVDNLGISAANHSDNLLLLPKLSVGVTRLDVLRLLRNAVDQCFLPIREKPKLRERIEQSLAKIFSKF